LEDELSSPSNKQQVESAGIKAGLYTVIVLALTYTSGTWLFGRAPHTDFVNTLIFWWPLILMWIPGIIAFLFRIFFRDGFGDLGWKIGNVRYWALAIAAPFGMAVFTYAIGYLTGKVSIDANILRGAMFTDKYGYLPAAWLWFTPDSLPVRLSIKLGVEATIGLLPEFIFALGEDLGWRGYLQMRLMQSKLPAPPTMVSCSPCFRPASIPTHCIGYLRPESCPSALMG
jgi:hypothetical protein